MLNNQPIFIATPRIGVAQVDSADPGDYDGYANSGDPIGDGLLKSLFSAGTLGSSIQRIEIKATDATTDGMIRIYQSPDGGTTFYLWQEVIVTAISPAANVETFEATIERADSDAILLLPASWSLYASTENAETFNVIAEGGDF